MSADDDWKSIDPTNLPGGRTPFSPSSSPRAGIPPNQLRTGGDYGVYTPTKITDPNYAKNRVAVDNQIDAIDAMPTRQMQNARSIGSVIDQSQQAQFRNQQLTLGQQLMDQANGNGPSVAGSQLQQSTEQNLQAAMAQAASAHGGNLGATQYALSNARANIQQQAAMGLAQTRIQEQMAARSQLGDVLNSGRTSDIGLATNQAQLGQQNNQFNAGQIQTANNANLQAGINQDQFKQDQKAKLLQLGYSEDQANVMLGLQQDQYTSSQLNAGEAARHGVALQQQGQGIQLGGALAAAGATALAALA